MDMQRKKEKERVQKEIDKLKESIQTLTKAYDLFKSSLKWFDFRFLMWNFIFRSIPLGRTLDFLQEDIDMMQKEISKWSDEYDKNVRDLKRQQKYVCLGLGVN